MIWDADSYYLKSHCLFHNTLAKMQIKNLTVKDSKLKETKAKKLKLTLDNTAKPAKKKKIKNKK